MNNRCIPRGYHLEFKTEISYTHLRVVFHFPGPAFREALENAGRSSFNQARENVENSSRENAGPTKWDSTRKWVHPISVLHSK